MGQSVTYQRSLARYCAPLLIPPTLIPFVYNFIEHSFFDQNNHFREINVNFCLQYLELLRKYYKKFISNLCKVDQETFPPDTQDQNFLSQPFSGKDFAFKLLG